MYHEVFVKRHQLFPDGLGTRTLLLLILEVQQHVYLEWDTHPVSISTFRTKVSHKDNILRN